MENTPSSQLESFPQVAVGKFAWTALAGVFCVTALCPESASAQTPGASAAAQRATESAVRQAESMQQSQALRDQQVKAAQSSDQPPETYPGENQDLGPQVLLKQKQRKPLFEFSSDTMFTWTSNALSAGEPQDTGVTAETFSLALAPEEFEAFGGKLSLRAGYRHLLWVYDIAQTNHINPLNGSNFEMSTVFLGSSFSFKENWNASLGLDFNRLLFQTRPWSLQHVADPSNWVEGYVEWNPNWSLSRNIPLGDKTSVSVTYNGSYHFTDLDPAVKTGGVAGVDMTKSNSGDKLDNALLVSLSYTPKDKWVLQPSLRFSHSLYTQPQVSPVHRMDRAFAPGLTCLWLPSPRWALRWSVSGEFRHSNDPVSPNSSKVELGTGATLTWKF